MKKLFIFLVVALSVQVAQSAQPECIIRNRTNKDLLIEGVMSCNKMQQGNPQSICPVQMTLTPGMEHRFDSPTCMVESGVIHACAVMGKDRLSRVSSTFNFPGVYEVTMAERNGLKVQAMHPMENPEKMQMAMRPGEPNNPSRSPR